MATSDFEIMNIAENLLRNISLSRILMHTKHHEYMIIQ